MTKRSQKRRAGLLAPRRPRKWAARETDYGRHVLDATLAELHPPHRFAPPPIDEPDMKADHELLRSDLGKHLDALITSAMARAGALNSDEDPLIRMSKEAKVTLPEYESLAMHADGISWEEIAKRQHVSPGAARQAGYRGRQKLQKYLYESGEIDLISGPLRKSDSVLEDLEGGDEA